MKAIEVLKKYRTIDFGCDMSNLYYTIDEALNELEELEHRSCNNCKFDYKCSIQDSIIRGHELNGLVDIRTEFITNPFYCNRYESCMEIGKE